MGELKYLTNMKSKMINSTSHNFRLYTVFLFLILLHSACKMDSSDKFDERFIKMVANETDTGLPSQFSFISFYVKCNDNQIAIVNIEELKVLHSLKYKKLDYLTFLRKALNQEMNLEYKDKIQCFSVDREISTMYSNNNFETFLSLYTDKVGQERVLKPSFENSANTIFYYCFLNNFVALHDDYTGRYYLKKTTYYYE